MSAPRPAPTRATGLDAREELEKLATLSVLAVAPEVPLVDVVAALTEGQFEIADEVVVRGDDGRVLGVASIGAILAAERTAPIGSIMDADPPMVPPGLHPEAAAWKAVKHGEASLVIVDEAQQFHGLVPAHRLLRVMLAEHDEDMARMGGFLHGQSIARAASEENVGRRFLHRVPWLLFGLGGAFVAADIVGAFEGDLEGDVTLAFFIPGVVYLADAVGTQTEAILIRSLAAGLSIRRMVAREIMTGIAIGLALGLVFFPITVLRWGDVELALAVSLALSLACAIANLIALALPLALHRLGSDPAFGSGPVATVVQDLLSILIYFAIVTWLVT